MEYQTLTMKGFIDDVKDASQGPHPRKFCFVLGAGASKSSGIPSGENLVDRWDRELQERDPEGYEEWKQKKHIDEKNKSNHYSDYYAKRFERDAEGKYYDGYNCLEGLMEKAQPSIGYILLALILERTSHKMVITTNFDHLVEDAVTMYTTTLPMVVGHESLAHYLTGEVTRPTVAKIHHDLLFSPLSKKENLETLHKKWKSALNRIFSLYHPNFIGYAGNDKSVMNFLKDNSKKFKDKKWKYPYWLIYDNQEPEGAVKEFLDASGAYLIRHQGFDSVMVQLGDALGCELPSRGSFMTRQGKTYDRLQKGLEKTQRFELILKIEENKDLGVESGNQKDKEVDAEAIAAARAMENLTRNMDKGTKQYSKAFQLHLEGKYKEELSILNKLVLEHPDNGVYRHALGATLYAMGSYDEALLEARKAVELSPEEAACHSNLGAVLYKMGSYDEALDEVRKAVELSPEEDWYHDSLGKILHELECYEEALVEKRKAAELSPEKAMYHDSVGATLNTMGRYGEALIEVRKALDLSPEEAGYHHDLGATLYSMGRYDEAYQSAQKAVELDPENPLYYDSLSRVLKKLGATKKAEEAKQKAEELRKKESDAEEPPKETSGS